MSAIVFKWLSEVREGDDRKRMGGGGRDVESSGGRDKWREWTGEGGRWRDRGKGGEGGWQEKRSGGERTGRERGTWSERGRENCYAVQRMDTSLSFHI